MVKEFELEVLKYITRAREGVKVLEHIPDTFLVDPTHAILVHILKVYYEEFGTTPHKANIKQYIYDAENVSSDITEVLMPLVGKVFDSKFEADTEHLKHKIVKDIQIHKTRELVSKFADKMETEDIFDAMFKDMRSVLEVDQTLFGSTDARFVLKDFTGFNHIKYDSVVRMPFEGMNDMMSAGGLFAPQVMVIMAPMKGFKSGIMVNIAVNCMIQGKKVLYADFENGEEDIINRAYCRMTEANYEEMTEDININTLKEIVKFSGVRGGDIYVKSYEMFNGTPGQVRSDIERLVADDWHPDVIIWDYADIASPSNRDDRRQDKRLRIQTVYGEIKNINKEFKTVSITASQMNRASLGNATAGMEDLAEDIGKAANTDAVWAILQVEEEAKSGVGRLQPVVQRKGQSFTGTEFVYLKLDKQRQHAVEISKDVWEDAAEVVDYEDDLEDI